MKRKEVDFPKKQNVTFYEKDKEASAERTGTSSEESE